MKVDVRELEKVDNAIEDIEGWKTKDIKAWETASGKSMITIRLQREDKEDKKEKTETTTRYLNEEAQANGPSSVGVGTELVEEDPDYDELYPEEY